jgi:hypothetical protein
MKRLGLGVLVIFLAGCSSLPGLRVLTGEDTAETESVRVAENVDLVMADKSGDLDSSMIASADRVEAAAGNVDIVQIRQDPLEDTFFIYLILRTEGDGGSDQLDQVLAYYDSIRRAVELTWQGTMNESRTSNFIEIQILQPFVIASLDEGPVYLAQKVAFATIERDDAIDYLSRPHNLDDFINLIVEGRMSWGPPPANESLFYGTVAFEAPNHPVYMFPVLLQ